MSQGLGKRCHDQFERDAASNLVGVGATLSHLKASSGGETAVAVQADDATPGENQQSAQGNGEWTIVNSKKRKKRKTNSAGKDIAESPTAEAESTSTYPSITHSPGQRLQRHLRLGDLQSLALYLTADGTAPQFVAVKSLHSLRKVVMLMVPGLERGMFDGSVSLEDIIDRDSNGSVLNETTKIPDFTNPDQYYPKSLSDLELAPELTPLADMFPHMWPVQCPGIDKTCSIFSPLISMLTTPLPKNQEDKQKGVRPATESKSWSNQPCHITQYLADKDQLYAHKYPVHLALLSTEGEKEMELRKRAIDKETASHGWVDSYVQDMPELTENDIPIGEWDVFAIDCEMCQTGVNDSELTRISVLDWQQNVILDELVKPDNRITDYLTQYSGITKEKLENVTMRLADVQAWLLERLTPKTILVGHSLESDLRALKLRHHAIVDTGIIYPHPGGDHLKSALRFLTTKYLSRTIQKGQNGHDSIEDAKAALDLVKVKCNKGLKWGTYEATTENIFKRIARATRPADTGGGNRTTACVDWGFPKRGFGGAADVCISCESDEEVVAGVKRVVNGDEDGSEVPGGGVEFAWARLRELEAMRGWWYTSKTADNEDLRERAIAAGEASALTEAEVLDDSKAKVRLSCAVAKTVEHIKDIYDSLPPCTAFIVYSGGGDTRELSRLQALHAQYKKEYAVKKWNELSVKWTDTEERAQRKAYKIATEGIGFLTVE